MNVELEKSTVDRIKAYRSIQKAREILMLSCQCNFVSQDLGIDSSVSALNNHLENLKQTIVFDLVEAIND